MHNLLPDEEIDDLQLDGLYIIQKKDGFRFGVDAVLLADFAARSKMKTALDLCTGNGIVPILLSAKSKARKICGIEIQRDICDMAKRSVELNGLSARVEITEGDLKDAVKIYGRGRFDTVTCNPPYMKSGAGLVSGADSKMIARHEILCALDDVIRVSAELLIPMGKFFMVHRPARMADIICTMREYKIEPKTIRLVSPAPNKPPNLMLISGVKGGGSELKWLPELRVYDETGAYSEEINKIYNRS